MSRRRRVPERWRIKSYLGLIRQVRGRALLEALHRLQDGVCAYDGQLTALLLPHVFQLDPTIRAHRGVLPRFATLDHVVPRFAGGANVFTNLVMASQESNSQKGSKPPIERWAPNFNHKQHHVEREIAEVERERWTLAEKLATNRWIDRPRATRILIGTELRGLGPLGRLDEFYDERELMIA